MAESTSGKVETIFVTPTGGQPMEPVDQIEAIAGRGLAGDRYCERRGYWTNIDECQVTLIEAEDLERIQGELGIQVLDGQHRRNFVMRGIRLDLLLGKSFCLGEAEFQYDRPRPPCSYIQGLTEPGMTRALAPCGGVCAKVTKSGVIKVGDTLEELP